MLIKSHQNQIFKELIKLKDKKFRDKNDIFLVEGKKQVEEIPGDWRIKKIILSENYADTRDLKNAITFSKRLFVKLSSTQSPQGIIAVVEKKHYSIEELTTKFGLFIILENIQDPGNLGTIIRSADAFGASAVFVSKGSADIYSDKTVRSTIGSLFHLPAVDNVDIKELIALMKKEEFTVFAASLKSNQYLNELKITNKIALIIGNESSGIKQETETSADILFKIHMPGEAESLNAAVAASIIMYELSKRR